MEPLLLALDGHTSLEEVQITVVGSLRDQELVRIRLAHMPMLRSCTLQGFRSIEPVALELEGLPALECLCVDECVLVEVSYKL